jgi:hypothetical protein
VDETHGIVESELRQDIVLHDGGGRGGKRQHRRGTQQVQVLAEHAVVGAKIVAPLRDAVRLVDGDKGWLALAEHLGEAGNAKPLRRDEEKLQGAAQVVDAGLSRRLAIEAGVDAGDAQTACCKLGRLVLHEGDERTDDQCRAAASYGRQLVAERLSSAGGHDQQQIAPGDSGAADLLLINAEGWETEGAGEQIAEAASFRRGNVSKERWPGRLGHGVDPSSHSARGGEAVPGTRPRLAGVDGRSVGPGGVRLEV